MVLFRDVSVNQGSDGSANAYRMPTVLTKSLKWVSWMNWKPLLLKKNKIWIWTAVDHFSQGILGWVLGDHSAETFRPLWAIVATWKCYFYVADGWSYQIAS
jgi:IS1 family transposase